MNARRPLTAAGRRRSRDRRLAALRRFGDAYGWTVLGVHQDLARRYPVAPLLGATSAQAELTLSGTWEEWSAAVMSVLVRSPRDQGHDRVVQLTALDVGPLPWRFSATWHRLGPIVVLLGPQDATATARITAAVRAAGGLAAGDQVVADQVELLHARDLTGRGAVEDVSEVLRGLAATAHALG